MKSFCHHLNVYISTKNWNKHNDICIYKTHARSRTHTVLVALSLPAAALMVVVPLGRSRFLD